MHTQRIHMYMNEHREKYIHGNIRGHGCKSSIAMKHFSPQQGDLRLLGPPSGRGTDGGARTRDTWIGISARSRDPTSHQRPWSSCFEVLIHKAINIEHFCNFASEAVPNLVGCTRRYIYATVSSADAERSVSLYNIVLSSTAFGEFLVTNITLVWFLACVNYLMSRKMPTIPKLFTTEITLTWSLARANSRLFSNAYSIPDPNTVTLTLSLTPDLTVALTLALTLTLEVEKEAGVDLCK
ncbi:hypothetical protein PoB_005024500 [Plakobranchus ocellatus]|uniref:Gustatory receptor n=1 Tax=Plakobranchus ocellatus TaxID=259542 RepID=A0AAV4BTG4_9GAST|nr:hypothetical protein PoB_005024500 [Plakobranchus ocellatus]